MQERTLGQPAALASGPAPWRLFATVILARSHDQPYICWSTAMSTRVLLTGVTRPNMRSTSTVLIYILCAIIAGACSGAAAVADEFAFHHENVMGTSLELRVQAGSPEAAREAEETVFREIDRLAAIFSGYDPASEFSRWQATSGVPAKVSPELWEVLRTADRWTDCSGGAFNPRVEALTRLWSSCALRGRKPTVEELAAAQALMSRPAWRLDEASRTALRLSICPLSLNGIAKGYVVGRACDAAFEKNRGVRGVLLNVGGDLRVRGEIASSIGIVSPSADSESSEPLAFVEIKDRSLATSGSSQRGLWIDGQWYSHIFDPRTGQPVARVASATVIAKDAADADAFAKVCSILAPDESLRLARASGGMECLIVSSGGRVVQSDGWQRLQRPRPLAAAADDGAADGAQPKERRDAELAQKSSPLVPWNKELELVINFEINSPEAEKGRYRRPYVAVWVEDKDGRPVRTLVLWVSMGGSGPYQWLPDLKRWYQGDQDRKLVEKKEIFFTVSRPTRPPGKYKIIWDGKDNHGRQLEGGEYMLTIEAAREHGTYQSIRKQMTLTGKPFREELKGNVEIRSASIEYRRKAPAK
jgi:thiamine biosynthesis lipoprotein ApbE